MSRRAEKSHALQYISRMYSMNSLLNVPMVWRACPGRYGISDCSVSVPFFVTGAAGFAISTLPAPCCSQPLSSGKVVAAGYLTLAATAIKA